MTDSKFRRALVTGASSGIGEQMARQLAARGVDLVLVARRRERLDALAAELEKAHGVSVSVLAEDLGAEGAANRVFEAAEGGGVPVDVLINNAGFGTHAAFVEIPWEKVHQQMTLNLVALTELCHLFLGPMRQRGRGWILNVASIGAFLPTPNYATYGAGKAYVRNFSEALSFELRGSGVSVTCLCPGPTTTEFMDAAGHEVPDWQKVFFRGAGPCASVGLRALEAGRPLVVDGIGNRIMMWSLRLVPRRLLAWIAARAMG